MQDGDLWGQRIGGPAVINNIIGAGQALLPRGLGGQDTLRLFRADAIARLSARQLQVDGQIDDRDAIRLRREVIFDQQWHHPQGVGGGYLRQLALGLRLDKRVQQGVKPGLFLRLGKNDMA